MATKNTQVVRAKVATIVSDDQIAINTGSKSGVKIGDTLTIRREVRVTDPDTKEDLGTVSLIRLRLRITMVSESFSIGTVTDEAPSETFGALLNATRVKRFKSVTAISSQATDTTIYVTPGEIAIVTRALDDADAS